MFEYMGFHGTVGQDRLSKRGKDEDRTEQYRSEQCNIGQDRSGQGNMAGQDRKGQGRAGQGRIGQDRSDRAGKGRIGQDRAGLCWTKSPSEDNVKTKLHRKINHRTIQT
jgi:hypothetical protein